LLEARVPELVALEQYKDLYHALAKLSGTEYRFAIGACGTCTNQAQCYGMPIRKPQCPTLGFIHPPMIWT
jgi:hypothetical protein